MREIVFRGKLNANGKWSEGNLHIDKYRGAMVITPDETPLGSYGRVDPDTVGQYTGLTDKNGVKIFEGDVVTGLFLYALPINGCVGFREGAFGLHWMRGGWEEFTPFTSMCHVEFEIIGNVHDNPELLGGTENVSHS